MWLDAVRYSDSNGFDWDEWRTDAWRFRDYVVDAWNRDLPFDRFMAEQLAGDELLPGLPEDEDQQRTLIATGYLRLGPQDNAAPLFNEQDRSRAELLADLTETTASAFLGLTLACCRCHDHKTDPLSQADHYRFRAFFANVEYGDTLSIDLAAKQREIDQRNAPIQQEIDKLEEEIKKVPDSDKGAKKELKKKKEELAKTLQTKTTALLMTESVKQDRPTHVLFQGDHRAPREEVQPGFPSVLFPETPAIEKPIHPKTSGRRLTLARWLARNENPWTARVIVNRLWQVHFGEGLVATENDFGWTGEKPTQPELLDWLASELMASGWSIKHIQRLIVTSRVYQQQISRSDNQGSMRKGLRRLSAEQLRDAILLVSGSLRSTAGGPPIWPKLPNEILQANPAFLDDNAMKTKGWYPSPKEMQTVRSIYLIQKRTVRVPWLETFDLPENSVSCPQRETSIVPSQALTLLNAELTLDAAEQLAKSLFDLEAREAIDQLFRRVFQRPPSSEERELSEAFLARGTDPKRALRELSRALLNTNEFIFYE